MKPLYTIVVAVGFLNIAAQGAGPVNVSAPPVHQPISLDVLAALADSEIAKWGFIDITAAPFKADPSGKRDATSAIQAAIDLAVEAQMVVFFPPGVYTVSDSIRVFGYGGNAAALPGTALFVVERTPNFLIANMTDTPRFDENGAADHFAGHGVNPDKWSMLEERTASGDIIQTKPMDRPAVYRRGNPCEE